jgi:hypothetical protein
MGTITNARLVYGLSAQGTPTRPNVANDVLIGIPQTAVSLRDRARAYSLLIKIGVLESAEIDPATGVVTATAGTSQVETATAVGTITLAGNATVTIASARFAVSPIVLSVPVALSDTAATWAGKVRNAISANAEIASIFTISAPSANQIRLTETIPAFDNDSTLNIALANGTCTGITAAPTSANTTAGVAGAVTLVGSGVDFEGLAFTSSPKEMLIRCLTGTISVSSSAGLNGVNIAAGQILMQSANSLGSISVEGIANGTFDITVTGNQA